MAATISATARKAIDIRLIDARNALSTKERFETPATTPCLFAFARHSRNPEARILALTTLIARAGHTLQKQDRDLWEQIKSVLETYFEKDSIPNHILDRFRYDGPTNGLRIWAHGVLHKREKVADNDIPDVIKRWKARDAKKDMDRTAKAFFVPVGEIRENKYDLSINRYKELTYQSAQHESPTTIIQRMRQIEAGITADLAELESLLK